MITPQSTSLDDIKAFTERNKAIILGYASEDKGLAIMCTRESEYNAFEFLEKAVEEGVARSTGNYLLMDGGIKTTGPTIPWEIDLDEDGNDYESDGKFLIFERRK